MNLDAGDRETILGQLEHLYPRMEQLARDLVRLPSETHPPSGDEGPSQEFVKGYLAKLGLHVDVFEPSDTPGLAEHQGYWPGFDYRGRPNVVGVLAGRGGGRSLVLNGHIDVVPAGERKLWQHDPYGGEIAGGRLFGRGAVDMKGPLAASIFAVECILAAGYQTLGNVILESVVNEELGGYNGTLACILKGYEADAAIVCEPTRLKICPGTKGGQAYRMHVSGEGAHSSLWWKGISALDNAIKLKRAMESFQDLRTREMRNHPLYSDPELFPIPALVDDIYLLTAGEPGVMGVPNKAVMEFWLDVLPGEEYSDVLARFEACVRACAENDTFMNDHPPSLERMVMRPIYPTQIKADHPIVSALGDASMCVTGKRPPTCGFESACDAMMFNLFSNTPCLVFGPGDLGAAHRPDESVDLHEMLQYAGILALTIVSWCGCTKG